MKSRSLFVCSAFVVLIAVVAFVAYQKVHSTPTIPETREKLPSAFVVTMFGLIRRAIQGLSKLITPASVRFIDISTGPFCFQLSYAVAKLNIASAVPLGDIGISTAEIAATLKLPSEEELYRTLRAASTCDIFQERPGRMFVHTDLSLLLRDDHPNSFRSGTIVLGEGHWGGISQLHHHLATGEDCFKSFSGGLNFWEYLALPEHAEEAEHFNKYMVQTSQFVLGGLTADYDWSRHDGPDVVVADIAGGLGTVLNLVLQKMPHSRGILFDMPRVIAQAKLQPLWAPDVAERVGYVAGDMFESVPEADLYIMRWIIHDWNDEESVRILKTVRKSMKPTSRLIIIEEPMPEEGEPMPVQSIISPAVQDLLMMVVVDGKHRTMTQYNRLFAEAGMRFDRLSFTRPRMGIIEVVPIPQSS